MSFRDTVVQLGFLMATVGVMLLVRGLLTGELRRRRRS